MKTLNVTCNSCQPLYQLWQRVKATTNSSELGPLTDVGYINGVAFNPPGTLVNGFWYLLTITEGQWKGYADWVPEDEITAL